MRAFIPAAGLGTRLKPLTDTLPKALVPVEGVPLLERVIRHLQGGGYDEFVINLHHFASQVEQFLAYRSGFGSRIFLSDERDLLRETGGGLRHASRLLADAPQGRFLIHNVDILCDFDPAAFDRRFEACETPQGKPHLADLLVTRRETSRYLLFDSRMHLAGWTDTRTGEVRSPHGKIDPMRFTRAAFAGIHNLSTAVFPLMEAWPERFPIIDFYLSHCREYTIRGILGEGIRVTDAGKAQNLLCSHGVL